MATYDICADVIWSSDLAIPARPPALVYLDMLGFINLAKVKTGTAPNGYAPLLEASRRARAEGRALFPLSSTHVLETYNITSIDQRRSVAAVMEELSDFHYMLGRDAIQRLEVEAAMNDVPGVTIEPQGPIPLIGPSILWAYGKRGSWTTKRPRPGRCRATRVPGHGHRPRLRSPRGPQSLV
jgi:hypothetical protein